MKNILNLTLRVAIVGTLLYGIIGTSTRVDEIKNRMPKEMESRNWQILRYEGYQLGSFTYHGGKVWYHVANKENPNIQYRVFVTLWNNELHFYYNEPETLVRAEIK